MADISDILEALKKGLDVFTKGVLKTRRTRRVLAEDEGISLGSHSILIIESPEIVVGDEIQTVPIAGTFISGRVSKIDGANGSTTVELKIDRKTVVKMSFDKAQKLGLNDKNNPYGIAFYQGTNEVETLTIGFSTPLFFVRELEIIVHVEEANVNKIEAVVVWGTRVSLGDEEIPDDDDDTDFP